MPPVKVIDTPWVRCMNIIVISIGTGPAAATNQPVFTFTAMSLEQAPVPQIDQYAESCQISRNGFSLIFPTVIGKKTQGWTFPVGSTLQ